MDARRERVTIVSGEVGKLFDQSGGFFVGWVKVLHNPGYGAAVASRRYALTVKTSINGSLASGA